MGTIYNVALAVGILLPLVLIIGDLLFTAFDSFVDALHLAACPGDMTIGLLPISTPAVCTGLIFFGGVGRIQLLYGSSTTLSIVISVLCGYVAAVVVQSFMNKLKRHKAFALESDSVLHCTDGKVVNAILPHSLGKVSFLINDQILSFIARGEDGEEKIPQDAVIEPVGFDDKILVVRKKREA